MYIPVVRPCGDVAHTFPAMQLEGCWQCSQRPKVVTPAEADVVTGDRLPSDDAERGGCLATAAGPDLRYDACAL